MGCDGSHQFCGYGDHPGTACSAEDCSSCALGIPPNKRNATVDTHIPGWCLDCGHVACKAEANLVDGGAKHG